MHPVNTLKASPWNSIIMPHRGPYTPLYFPPCEPRRIVGQLVMAEFLGADPAGIFRGSEQAGRPSSCPHRRLAFNDTCARDLSANEDSRVFSLPSFFHSPSSIRDYSHFRHSRWSPPIRLSASIRLLLLARGLERGSGCAESLYSEYLKSYRARGTR